MNALSGAPERGFTTRTRNQYRVDAFSDRIVVVARVVRMDFAPRIEEVGAYCTW